jgi:hypothetical protein
MSQFPFIHVPVAAASGARATRHEALPRGILQVGGLFLRMKVWMVEMTPPPDHFADWLSWGDKWQPLKKLVAQWVRKTLVAKR